MPLLNNKKIILLLTSNIGSSLSLNNFTSHIFSLPINSNWEILLAFSDNDDSFILADENLSNKFIYKFVPGVNLGYLNGCNFAFYKLKNLVRLQPDVVGIVNHDITFNHDFFINIGNYIDNNNDLTSIISPLVIRSSDNSIQNIMFYNRPSIFKLFMLSFVYKFNCTYRLYLFLSSSLIKNIKLFSNPLIKNNLQNIFVYAPHGAAMFFTKEFFDKGGSFKFPSFLYCEEIFIGEQAIKNNLKVILIPTLALTHHEHISTSTLAFSVKRKWHLNSLKKMISYYLS